MNSPEAHRSRAEFNRDLAERLLICMAGDDRSWTVVIRFYSALHYLDAYLASKNIAVDSHGARKKAIRGNPELCEGRGKRFRTAYMWLQDRSEEIRYDPSKPFRMDLLEESRVKLGIVSSYLVPRLDS